MRPSRWSGSTRVEFDPPSLRPRRRGGDGQAGPRQRGSNSTLLHCGTLAVAEGLAEWWPTRVEFDPPSLRRVGLRGHLGGAVRQRGSNSTLLHCGFMTVLVLKSGIGQRGSNSTLLHCGKCILTKIISRLLATRVEFDPPSLRLDGSAGSARSGVVNEGRIRPSFIAAAVRKYRNSSVGSNEGRIRPSFIAAGSRRRSDHRPTRCNEGRIRPSFIAAVPGCCRAAIARRQRGSNSTLLHCGDRRPDGYNTLTRATRVEFDPPSLRPLAGRYPPP